jgi:hypothetical protein
LAQKPRRGPEGKQKEGDEGVKEGEGKGVKSAAPQEQIPGLEVELAEATSTSASAGEVKIDATTDASPRDPTAPTSTTTDPPEVQAPAQAQTTPPTLSKDPGERDRDLEDDLREAAQIVFYTSRDTGGVSRDTMLRQVGLAKGLMGFAG